MRLLWLGGGLVSLLLLWPLPAAAQLDDDDFFDRGRDRLEEEIERLDNPEPTIDLTTPPMPTEIPWHQLVVTEGAQFTAVLPGSPQTYEPITIATPDGDIDIIGWLTLYQDAQFFIVYGQYPPTTTPAAARLAAMRDRLVADTGWTVSTDQVMTFERYPGREFVLVNTNRQITYRFYLVAEKLYILGVMQITDAGASGDAIGAIATTFFNSFQTLPDDYQIEDLLPPGAIPVDPTPPQAPE